MEFALGHHQLNNWPSTIMKLWLFSVRHHTNYFIHFSVPQRENVEEMSFFLPLSSTSSRRLCPRQLRSPTSADGSGSKQSGGHLARWVGPVASAALELVCTLLQDHHCTPAPTGRRCGLALHDAATHQVHRSHRRGVRPCGDEILDRRHGRGDPSPRPSPS